MTHDYHQGLPGYSAAQILHDGCQECEARGANVAHAINCLDAQNFARACARATAWNDTGLPDISYAEQALLQALSAYQRQAERAADSRR